MRDDLPTKIHLNECGIINLDSKYNPGSHWTAYVKHFNNIAYFDSFGNLQPPIELVHYFYSNGEPNINIIYNFLNQQNFNSIKCGHLCLSFLHKYCGTNKFDSLFNKLS